MRKDQPYVMYNKFGDQLEIRYGLEAYVSDVVNEWLTICRSVSDRKKVIGVIITGFRKRFLLSGLKLDNNYDEQSPLTTDEQQEFDAFVQQLNIDGVGK